MIDGDEPSGDLSELVVPQAARLVATGDRYEPYRLVDADLLAAGRAESTVRSHGMDLLRSFRFLQAGEGR
jgi:hypothetical protein